MVSQQIVAMLSSKIREQAFALILVHDSAIIVYG
nr:MAG TPA: hypothetical protein [Bacteriophage sp.]